MVMEKVQQRSKSHMIIAIDAEKVSEQNRTSFHDKNFSINLI